MEVYLIARKNNGKAEYYTGLSTGDWSAKITDGDTFCGLNRAQREADRFIGEGFDAIVVRYDANSPIPSEAGPGAAFWRVYGHVSRGWYEHEYGRVELSDRWYWPAVRLMEELARQQIAAAKV